MKANVNVNEVIDLSVLPADYRLSERQASNATGVTMHCLRRWRCEGRGPKYRKIGPRMVRYRVADLRSFFDAFPAYESTAQDPLVTPAAREGIARARSAKRKPAKKAQGK